MNQARPGRFLGVLFYPNQTVKRAAGLAKFTR